jgi:hypothetical protein
MSHAVGSVAPSVHCAHCAHASTPTYYKRDTGHCERAVDVHLIDAGRTQSHHILVHFLGANIRVRNCDLYVYPVCATGSDCTTHLEIRAHILYLYRERIRCRNHTQRARLFLIQIPHAITICVPCYVFCTR